LVTKRKVIEIIGELLPCGPMNIGAIFTTSANAQYADERASIMKTLQGSKTNDISSIFIPMDLA
jgi:hypothetical protein